MLPTNTECQEKLKEYDIEGLYYICEQFEKTKEAGSIFLPYKLTKLFLFDDESPCIIWKC